MAKKYSILGIDGNAFCIMGYVCTAMAREAHHLGWGVDELAKQKKAYMDDAMSGNYDHLVAISDKMIERINKAMETAMEVTKMRTNGKVGDTIKILHMKGEPKYSGKIGVVEFVDSAGQLHGSWGGLAIQPENDSYEILVHA